ncbi:MAG: hypothetical protein LPH21_12560 [Shewanella sp.]|nr:hypothetical protein [Shewanella sp.]
MISPFVLNNFNGGIFSPLLSARNDFGKYKNGFLHSENLIPLVQGPLTKRPGTEFIAEVKYSDLETRLFSFNYSEGESYILEFGHRYIRFYTQGGRLEVSGDAYEIETVYQHDQLAELQLVQSADVVFLAHPQVPPYKLSRQGVLNWTIAPVEFDWPAMSEENVDPTSTILASSVKGTVVLTASSELFDPQMEGSTVMLGESIVSKHDPWKSDNFYNKGQLVRYQGRVYRAANDGKTGLRPPVHLNGIETDGEVQWEYQNDGEGYVKITKYWSANKVEGAVKTTLPLQAIQEAGTDRWALSAWSTIKGYPSCICFHEDRLWVGGTSAQPQTLWASVSGDYENFKLGSEADSALSYTINSQQMNKIVSLTGGKTLFVGTKGGEFIATGGSPDEAITPSNIRITRRTPHGCASMMPLAIGNAIIFIPKTRKKVRELVYQLESDSHVATDLSVLSDHLLTSGIKQFVYSDEPNPVIWCCTESGELVGMTYDRQHEVAGWHAHSLGGEGKVRSIATGTTVTGDDDLYFIVERNLKLGSRKYIEIQRSSQHNMDAHYTDAALSYEGVPASVFSNLGHLEGERVAIVANGIHHEDRVVENGKVSLDFMGSSVQIGLGYASVLETHPWFVQVGKGDSIGSPISIGTVRFGTVNSNGRLFYNAFSLSADVVSSAEYNVQANYILVDSDEKLNVTEGVSIENSDAVMPFLQLRHSDPLPFTLGAIFGEIAI